jgi:P27 family predicted phage terminase small subunit
MGLRGPPPKPTALRVLEGNPSGRPFNENEPKPNLLKTLEAPDELSDRGKAAWFRLIPELVRIGIMTEVDREAMIRYFDFLEEYKTARDFIRANGRVYPIKDNKGKVKYIAQFPHVSIMRNASAHMLKLEQNFGLTPAARSRMIAVMEGRDGEESDPFDYSD